MRSGSRPRGLEISKSSSFFSEVSLLREFYVPGDGQRSSRSWLTVPAFVEWPTAGRRCGAGCCCGRCCESRSLGRATVSGYPGAPAAPAACGRVLSLAVAPWPPPRVRDDSRHFWLEPSFFLHAEP